MLQIASQAGYDGLQVCARFAFKPNALNYCGPDKNKQLFSYLKAREADDGLREILSEFEIMYPYLKLIAASNRISDPFSKQVVEAYWLGNSLLNKVRNKELINFLDEAIQLKNKLNKKTWQKLLPPTASYGLAHHNWHVLSIAKRTAHLVIDHTLDSLDNCMIKAGKVAGDLGDYWLVKTKQLRYRSDRLILSSPIILKIDKTRLINNLHINDLVALHWGEAASKISFKQARNLNNYTNYILTNLIQSSRGEVRRRLAGGRNLLRSNSPRFKNRKFQPLNIEMRRS